MSVKEGACCGCMAKVFNINADCKPGLHYMVDVSGRLKQIKSMVDAGDYFTINRARQYGKTTVPQLGHMIEALLFQGKKIAYNPDDEVTGMALMFGFVKTDGSFVSIANRIFEIRLYNLFLTVPQVQENGLYQAAVYDQNQFVEHGHLNMRLVLEKFVRHFHDLYAGKSKTFYEEDGRRYFLLYLRPIINGSGNYYVEAQTRDHERTDVIVDYHGEQFVIEMKIWRGNAYHVRGEQQLLDYLEYYHLEKGYLLSFHFNKNKTPGVHEMRLGDKVIVEAVV